MSAQSRALYPTEEGFLPATASDEFLHPDVPDDADFTLSETSYFGFNVPEADISCEIYAWFHPTLGLVSGGLMIFQGYKTLAGQAEYLDYRNVLPFGPGDIDDVQYASGVRVKVVKPLEEILIEFDAPQDETSFSVTYRAVMPPALRADGKHFVQVMKVTGELTLRGETHVVDSWFTRDRSFLLPRSEAPHPVDPISWTAIVFGDDLAFHVVGRDAATLDPGAADWGYVWRDGELRAVDAMRKTTTRDEGGVWPLSVEIELRDSHGDTYLLRGTGRAMLPFPFWPNMITNLMFTRWELDGRIGHGDYQDIHFGHSLRATATPTHR